MLLNRRLWKFGVLVGVMTALSLKAQNTIGIACPAQAAPGGSIACSLNLGLSAGVNIDSLTFGVEVTPNGSAPAVTSGLTFTTPISGAFVSTGGTTNSLSAFWQGLSPALTGNVGLGSIGFSLPTALNGQSYAVAITGASASYSNNAVNLSIGGTASIAVVGPPAIGLNRTALSFTAVQGGSNPACQTAAISNSGGGTLNWTGSVTNGGAWLSVNPPSGINAGNITACVTVGSLPATTYSGAIQIASNGASNSPQVIQVTLVLDPPTPAITLSSTSLSFTGTIGGTNPANQIVSVSNTGGGTLNWSASITSGGTWLRLVGGTSGNNSGSVTVGVYLVNLPANTYYGNIQFSAAGASNSPQNLPVTLIVNQAPPAIGSSCSSLVFQAVQGGSSPASQTCTISNTGGGTLNWSASVTSGGTWLSLTGPASGTNGGSITVAVTLGNLTANAYKGNIGISASGATTQNVAVTLTVSAPAPLISFGLIPNQVLGAAPFSISAAASSGLTVVFVSTTPSVCTVSGNIVTLVAVGTCSITASQPGNSAFAAAAPVTQSFVVSNGAAAGLTTYTYNGNPLASVQPPFTRTNAVRGFFTTPTLAGDLTAVDITSKVTAFSFTDGSVNTISAANGETRFVVSTDSSGKIVAWDITLVLGSPPANVALFTCNGITTYFNSCPNGPYDESYKQNGLIDGSNSSSPGTWTAGQSSCNYVLAPASQVIPDSGSAGSIGVLTSANCAWTASTAASFLSIASGAGGIGPGTIQFAATANTGAAARSGAITVLGQTATINQAGTTPLFLLTPTTASLQWQQQSSPPAAISLSVFTSASSLSFTATASSTGNWLSVNPGSGSAPTTVTVSVDPSSLAPGVYQGTVTVAAPAANPSSQTLTVSLIVTAPGSPTLSVSATSLTFASVQGAQEAQQQTIPIGNSGAGTLSFQASASTNSGGSWLSVTHGDSGTAVTTPVPLTVTANPIGLATGTYTGEITVTANTTLAIPVTLTISAVTQTILLSQTALTFTAVSNAGPPPAQSFAILNGGAGAMNWSVAGSTVSGGNWLSLTPTSGASDPSSSAIPLLTVSVNPASLGPGQYSGLIQVTSSTANNTPEFVSVTLNVLPSGSNPGPLVLPAGLIFAQAPGAAAAASQTVTLANLTGLAESFATSTLTDDGANWLSVTPASGTVSPTQATTVTVSVNDTGLSPAIRGGIVTLFFQDGSVRTVNILSLLAGNGSGGNKSASRPLTTSTCAPTKLLPLVTSLGTQFTVPAAWPTTVSAQVIDDCGNPDVSGTVTASFSNGDPPVPLISLKNGAWTGTWQVNNANTPVIVVNVNADNAALNISGAVSVQGGIQNSVNAPVLTAGGVLNAASYAPSAPLSPGSMISIFGTNLANGASSAATFPLPWQLAGTLVSIGGVAAPLLYAGTGQINAIVPYGLPVNTTTQVIVQQGNAYTTPQGIVLAAAAPAIFTQSATGSGQGVIVDYTSGHYAEASSPAQGGDEIVIYAGGLGATTPSAANGQAATVSPLLEVAGVSVTIAGQPARVDFAGVVPGYSGLYQINAAVPAGVHGSAVPVVVTVAGQSSPPVTMAVQ